MTKGILLANSKKTKDEEISFWERITLFISWLNLTYIISFSLILLFFATLYFIHLTVLNDKAFKYHKNSLNMKNELPRWIEENGLTSKIKLNTREVSKTYIGQSFFDGDTLGSLHTALMKTHWVKEVSLEKSFPSKINMTVNFRKPVVAFLVNEFWYSLDAEGFVVPVVERKGAETLDVVRLMDSPEIKHAIKPGELIESKAIKKALNLYLLVAERITSPGKLTKIIFLDDAKENAKDNSYRYKLIYQNGLEILWGKFLLDDEVDRFPSKYLTSEEKLALLFTSLGKNPHLLHINVEFTK